MLLYTILQILLLPFLLAYFVLKLFSGRGKISEIALRLKDVFVNSKSVQSSKFIVHSIDSGSLYKNTSAETILFHAASVGETKIAVMLAGAAVKRKTGATLVLAVSTKAGKKLGEEFGVFDRVLFFPLDLPVLTGIFVKNINPVKAVIIETEMWPRMYSALKKRARIYVANGRFSDRSFARYRKTGFFFGRYFKMIDYYFARTDLDFERARELGVRNGKVFGNIKYNYEAAAASDAIKEKPLPGRIVVFGSIREKEEADIAALIRDLGQSRQDVSFVIAPRHTERASRIGGLLSSGGIGFRYGSGKNNNEEKSPIRALILDEIGGLFDIYRHCDIAFAGGSLYDYGGQNPVEPAFFAKPVIFGPYMSNFTEESELLLATSGAIRVWSAAELKSAIFMLLDDPARLKDTGQRAYECCNRLKCDIDGMMDEIIK